MTERTDISLPPLPDPCGEIGEFEDEMGDAFDVGQMIDYARAAVIADRERTDRELLELAALYVETDGCYFGLPSVDPWDEDRDARQYNGPHPVVAHPPCQRWGRFWHGSTRKPHQFKLGDDDGCFAAALSAVRRFGGVLEHPCDSHAWKFHGLTPPPRHAGWQPAGDMLGWTCYVEQGHYGHMSRKPTWLYAVGCDLPELNWSRGEQRLHPVALERYGYEKARRIGMTAMVGGKDKTRIRNATPPEFRDILIGMARTARAAAAMAEGGEQ